VGLTPKNFRGCRTPMQGSLAHIIWSICYLSVLIGLSAYGIHRYFIIYLYLKNRKRMPVPAGHFEKLPKVTVQLPIFNEVYVAERRSEEHTSELQSRFDLVCRLLLEKKKIIIN